MAKQNPTFFIDQHGCAKNQVDGELIVSLLRKKDYVQTFSPEEANLIIVNSCGFIESAKTESLNAVLSARKMYPKAKILLAGCLAERYADDLAENLPEADGIFGNGDLSQIYKVLDPLIAGERPVLKPAQKGVCCGDRDVLLSFAGAAYVKITEGCNNRCSFCAIPIIRGELRSRPADDIISEIKKLVAQGVYEINLIGQDLAAYGTGADDNPFGWGLTLLPVGTPGFQEGVVSPSAATSFPPTLSTGTPRNAPNKKLHPVIFCSTRNLRFSLGFSRRVRAPSLFYHSIQQPAQNFIAICPLFPAGLKMKQLARKDIAFSVFHGAQITPRGAGRKFFFKACDCLFLARAHRRYKNKIWVACDDFLQAQILV